MTRQVLLERIAEIISDYRVGEIPQPTPEHVGRWVSQFDLDDQTIILQETAHLLSKTYLSQKRVTDLISNKLADATLVGSDARAFWQSVGFLDLQTHSQSQGDILGIIANELRRQFGVEMNCGQSASGVYVYADDGIFSGNQVKKDVIDWIKNRDVKNATVCLVCIGSHSYGGWYAKKKIDNSATGRNINVRVHSCKTITDWPKNIQDSMVLNPTHLPDDSCVNGWRQTMPKNIQYFIPRPPNGEGSTHFFSSEQNREVLEQAFLKKGAYIWSLPENRNDNMRPLGFDKLHTPGFGTMLATYRNCPNNCPLVLWWGNPEATNVLNRWYPLMQRRPRAPGLAADF